MSRLSPRSFVALLALAPVLVGCGGASFERAAGAKKYRALPVGTAVVVQDTTDGLVTPIEVLGNIKLATKGKEESPDRAAADKLFKKYAARYGCDAVVGPESKSTSKDYKKKKRELGPDGRPVYKVEVTKVWTHSWKAQCVRTAKAPKEVKLQRDKYGRIVKAKPAGGAASSGGAAASSSSSSSGGAAASGSSSGGAAAGSSSSGGGATSSSSGGGSSGGAAAGSSSSSGGVAAPPPADTGDPKIASEVARAFLKLSRYFAAANVPMICKMLDAERVYFDVRTTDPQLEFKKDLAAAKACEAFKTGELGNYLRDFGPAEVHTEMLTLIPTLFRIHGGAYLKLDDAREKLYRTKLVESRKGKKPLACEMYTVLPAGNLYKVMLDCRGVRSYRLLLRRDGPDDFKLMALTHMR